MKSLRAFSVFLLTFGLALPLHGQAGSSADAAAIELAFLNGVYTNLDEAGMAPVERAGMTIHLSSPEHRLEVHGNRLSMWPPEEDGTARAELTVDFEGAGDLIARVEGMGESQTLEDHIEAPRQTVTVPGLIRLARVAGGYEVEIVALPPSVELEVRSGVAERLVGTCDALAKIPFLGISCAGLAESLAKVTVPLPGAGRRVVLSEASLREEEKAFFERFATTGAGRESELPP